MYAILILALVLAVVILARSSDPVLALGAILVAGVTIGIHRFASLQGIAASPTVEALVLCVALALLSLIAFKHFRDWPLEMKARK